MVRIEMFTIVAEIPCYTRVVMLDFVFSYAGHFFGREGGSFWDGISGPFLVVAVGV